MNRSLAEAIVAVIGDTSPENAEWLSSYSARHWRENHHWLVTSGLALHLLTTLRRLQAEDVLPPAYHAHLQALYHASGPRTEDLRHDLLDLNRRFTALAEPFVNWKGFALTPDFCPDIRLRNQTDFDFIIRPEDFRVFHRALLDSGYVLSGSADNEFRYDLLPGQPYSLDEVYSRKPHRRVELHLGSDSPPASGRPMDFVPLLDRRLIRSLDGLQFPVLAPEDAFVTHAAHAGKHALSGWVRIGWLLELDTFTRRYADDTTLWETVLKRIDTSSAISVGLALALSVRMWRRELPRALASIADVLPVNLVRWLDENGRRFVLSDFPGTKLHLFLHRELLDPRAFHDVERQSLYPIKVPPRVAYSLGKTPVVQRMRATRNQARFVLRRLKFHLVENTRYWLMKRRWERTVALGRTPPICNQPGPSFSE